MSKKIMKKPAILKNVRFRKMFISVYKLHASLNCQRELDDNVVNQIYTDWIDGWYNNPIVNFINGQYRLIGGQHTVAAYIKRVENGFENNVMIECKVADDLTEAQENAVFKFDEECRRSQTYDSKLKSFWNYTSEDMTDKESRKLHDINEILNSCGYTIRCNKNNNIIVDCTETLLETDNKSLKCVFNFIKDIFPNEKEATQGTFIKSIKYFLELFSEDIDMKKFKVGAKATKKRKALSASTIMENSKKYDQYRNRVKQIAYAIAIEYQDRVKKAKLPLYKFDMK